MWGRPVIVEYKLYDYHKVKRICENSEKVEIQFLKQRKWFCIIETTNLDKGELDMGQLYSIGKMSAMMGVSTQVLRHYCDIGLIKPEYVDPVTGYRLFSFAQFHSIDRTRYLLKCGFHLSEIKDILEKNDVEYLIQRIHCRQVEVEESIRQSHEILKTLRWYERYFTKREENTDISCYVRDFEARWLLAINCRNGYRHKDFYPLFAEVRNRPELAGIHYQRQFTSILDYKELMEGRRKRYHVGMFTMERPSISSPHLIEIPEGSYWCFKAPILSNHWDPCVLRMLVEEHGVPKLLLASEYENDLNDYRECPHEVQMLF